MCDERVVIYDGQLGVPGLKADISINIMTSSIDTSTAIIVISNY